jgi:hypothetical protein
LTAKVVGSAFCAVAVAYPIFFIFVFAEQQGASMTRAWFACTVLFIAEIVFVLEPLMIFLLYVLIPRALSQKVTYFADPCPLRVPHRVPLPVTLCDLADPDALEAFDAARARRPKRLGAAPSLRKLESYREALAGGKKGLDAKTTTLTAAAVERAALEESVAALELYEAYGETVKGAETEKNRAFRATHRAWAPKEVVDLERRMHPPRRWLETFALVFVGVLLKFPPDAQGLLIKESITLLSYFALAALAPDDATDGVALHTTLRVIALVVATAVVVVAANHTCGRGHVRSALRQHVGDRQGSEKMLDVDSDDSDDDDDDVAAVVTPDSADGGKGEERKSDAVADDDDSLRMSDAPLRPALRGGADRARAARRRRERLRRQVHGAVVDRRGV